MNVLSVCSGIGAPECAWSDLGWSSVAAAEIDKFPSAVLAARFPDLPNWGDMTRFKGWPDADVDVLVGGTPCQSFSVAGLRKGLDDPRGNLALTYLAVAARYRPHWLVWENVPGVLSSNGGRDFGAFLGGLGELGYRWAYRVIDAQYFGVPQRRRRVFVVGCLGGTGNSAAAVLFERQSLSGNPAPSRASGKVDPTIPSRRSAGGGLGTDFDCDGGLILSCVNGADVSHALTASQTATGRLDPSVETFVAFSCKDHGADAGDIAPTLRAMGHGNSHANAGGQVAVAYRTTGNSGAWSTGEKTDALTTGTDPNHHVVAIQERAVAEGASGPGGKGWQEGVAFTMEARNRPQNVATMSAVRRLTPTECERLQGFPDGWTDVVYRGKPAADGPRYKALGNSMAVPVMRWIGRRIQMVSDLIMATDALLNRTD